MLLVRFFAFGLSFIACLALAENHSAALSDAKVLSKVVTGLENSHIDELTSNTSTVDGFDYSYHLKAVSYLGTVRRDDGVFTVATAFFIRSSAKGSVYPPARGHGFIILFDPDFKISTYGQLEYLDYHMEEERVKLGHETLVDFSVHDELTRYRGFVFGGTNMPYPFKDRISEKDWETGAFRKNQTGRK